MPAWVEERGGDRVLIPERAAVIKRIYELAAAGYGQRLIVKRLTDDGVPAFCGKPWVKQYIMRVLKDRRTLGEFQPRTGGKLDGPPILNYYPAVVTEAEWLAVQAGRTSRRRAPGRLDKHINLFTGLVRNARERRTPTSLSPVRVGEGLCGRNPVRRVLLNTGANDGRARLL